MAKKKKSNKLVKEDKEEAARSLYAVLAVISGLRIIMYPFLPFSSQKVHEYLGSEGKVEDYGWKPQPPLPGQRLREPKPLFSKLDEELVAEETSRLGGIHC